MDLAKQKALGLVGVAVLLTAPVLWFGSALRSAGRIRFEPAKFVDTPEQQRLRRQTKVTMNGATSAAPLAKSASPPRAAQTKAPVPSAAESKPPQPVVPEPAFNGDGDSVSRLLNQARKLENTQPKRARQLVRAALEREPQNERALRVLATELLIDEDYAGALAASQRCTNVNPTNPICIKVNRELPKDKVTFEAVGTIVDLCLRQDERHLACLYGRFNLDLLGGAPLKALQAAARLTAASPDSAITDAARARLLSARGSYGAARVLFESACSKAFEAACFRAELLRSQGF